jgi:hypothetical protein
MSRDITHQRLAPKARRKVFVIGAGVKGGTGKTLTMTNIYSWYGYRFGVRARAWDLDRNQSFNAVVGAEWIFDEGQMRIEDVVGAALGDGDNEVFVADMPASSEDAVRDALRKVDLKALRLEGVHVVLVASVTWDRQTLEKLQPWLRFFGRGASVLLVRNWCDEEPAPLKVEGRGENEFVLEQGFYGPPETLLLLSEKKLPFHPAVFPYLSSYAEPYVRAMDRGLEEVVARMRKIRAEALGRYVGRMRNPVKFMWGAKVLDQFYYELDRVRGELLPASMQALEPGRHLLDWWDNKIPRVAAAYEAEKAGFGPNGAV